MKYTVFALLLLFPRFLSAQLPAEKSLTVYFQPRFQGRQIGLNEPLRLPGGDSLALHTLRFYLGHFVFFKNQARIFEAKDNYHLLDLEDTSTHTLHFVLPAGADFDALQFDLGVDSLTNVSGAMGGDLDPTKGMYWAWQSGYINVKLEGFCKKSPARNAEFQFHLGGYLPPFQSVQTAQVPAPPGSRLRLQLNLDAFFENVNWPEKHHIMSPSREAVVLSGILSKSFSLHAE